LTVSITADSTAAVPQT